MPERTNPNLVITPKSFTWSYSALTDFESCPHAFAEKKYYKRIIQEESDEIRWGNRVHTALEKYLAYGGKLQEPDPIIEPYKKYPDTLLNAKEKTGGELLVEQKFAVDRSWKICDFFAKEAYGRGVVDAGLVYNDKVLIIDYKTGKVKMDETQLKIFCLFTALKYPEINDFTAKFVWLKHNEVSGIEFNRADLLPLLKELLPRLKRMEECWLNERFVKRKNGLCGKWCPVLECEYNGRRG